MTKDSFNISVDNTREFNELRNKLTKDNSSKTVDMKTREIGLFLKNLEIRE